MKITRIPFIMSSVLAGLLLATAPISAQEPGGPGFDPGAREAFRQRMNERLKASLKVNEEEWAVIQPLLEKIQTKQRETMMSRFGGMMRGRGGEGRNGGGGNRPEAVQRPELEALNATLENENASPAEIKTRLEAVRSARKKALAELEQAREDLKKVLTQRQEAALVMVGILE